MARLPQLFKTEPLRRRFEETVVADAPAQIEQRVDSLIDWLVASELNQWQAVVEHVTRRRSEHASRVVGQVGGRFEADRARLLDTVGRAARSGLEGYERSAEARRMADSVQQALAGTAVVEVSAIGLGATVAAIASGTAADVTGLVAAGVLASLGLFIIPTKRRRAKRELHDRIAETRARLMGALEQQFRTEAERSLSRIRDAVAPYSRFVRAERERLGERNEALTAARAGLASVQERAERL
jgi:hypothetical protein